MKFASNQNDFLDESKETLRNTLKDPTKMFAKKIEKKKISFKDYARNLGNKRSLFAEFLILIVACSISPIIVSNTINYENSQTVLEKTAVTNLEMIADQNVNKIKSTIDFLKSDILSAGSYYNIKLNFPILVKFDKDKNNPSYLQAKQILDGQLLNLVNFKSLIDNVLLADKQGNIIYSTGSLGNSNNALIHGILKTFSSDELVGNTYISTAFLDTTRNKVEVFIISPDYGFDKKFLTWIVFEVPVKNLVVPTLNNLDIGNTGEINLAKWVDGKVMYLDEPKYQSSLANGNYLNFTSEEMSNALSGHSGAGKVKDYRNVDVIAAWRYLPEINAGLVVKIDANEALEPAKQLFFNTVVIVLASIAIATILAIFAVKSITLPISKIRKALNEISQGNLGITIRPEGNNELYSLASDVNTMSIKLQEATSQLATVKKKFVLLYETSPELCRTVDTNGIIIECNKSYAEHLGYSKDEIIGRSIFDHTAKESLKDVIQSFTTWKEESHVVNREMWFKRRDETTFPVLLSATPLYDDDGNLIGSNTVIRDITEVHQARKELEVKEIRLRLQYDELRNAHELLGLTEQKYRNLYEKTPVLLRTITNQGILTDCNDAYAVTLGYTKQEAIGMSVYDHTAEKSVKELRDNLEDWKKTHEVSHKEIWMKRKDGSIFPCLLSGGTLYDENGDVIGRTVALTDLTEIHQARKKLEEDDARLREQFEELQTAHELLAVTERKYKNLYEDSPVLLRTIDINGKILNCNKSYANTLGYTKDEIIGKSIFDHIAKNSLSDIIDSFVTWREEGHVENREMWFKRKDGTSFPVLLSATPLYDDDGNLIGSNTVIRNMSEIYSTKRALEEEKTKRFLAIGELSARIAHDLRNPLGVIKNSVAILKITNPDLDEGTKTNLARIDRGILRMTHQIDEVLDYVTPKPLKYSSITLSEILSSTLDRMILPDTVKVNLPKNDTKITCDHEKLEVVFVNLISNAIQAMSNKGEIDIRLLDGEDDVIIEVEDTGPGIPDDIMPKIFDPLFTTRQIGTGLGLPSCKSIIENHHGAIGVTNGSKGALFIIKLSKHPLALNTN
jgi:PAS domain S-box-containing protein